MKNDAPNDDDVIRVAFEIGDYSNLDEFTLMRSLLEIQTSRLKEYLGGFKYEFGLEYPEDYDTMLDSMIKHAGGVTEPHHITFNGERVETLIELIENWHDKFERAGRETWEVFAEMDGFNPPPNPFKSISPINLMDIYAEHFGLQAYTPLPMDNKSLLESALPEKGWTAQDMRNVALFEISHLVRWRIADDLGTDVLCQDDDFEKDYEKGAIISPAGDLRDWDYSGLLERMRTLSHQYEADEPEHTPILKP